MLHPWCISVSPDEFNKQADLQFGFPLKIIKMLEKKRIQRNRRI